GLAFAVFLVNGHNTSQSENLRETFNDRLRQWWLGSHTWSRKRRLVQWIMSGRVRRTARQLKWWWRIAKDARPVARVNENLALGWFPNEIPADPLASGNAFIMHATGPENGELWTRVGANTMPAIRGVQTLQTYYVVVLRERGAAYYAASVPNANGLSAYPNLRPLAIDPFNDDQMVYAALYQSVLGQIGFRLDTRVYGARVALLPGLATWYGTAHAADPLSGEGLLDRSEAQTGGLWRQVHGAFARTEHGAKASGSDNLALLNPRAPSGLVHVLVEARSRAGSGVGLVWRAQDADNFWRLLIDGRECELSIKQNGACTRVVQSDKWRLRPGKAQSVQILDD
ncbi:MAG: nucleotide-binding protein, partial [bacterium]